MAIAPNLTQFRNSCAPIDEHTRVELGQRDVEMEHIQQGYRGLHLLMDLNWDRLLYVGTLIAALGCGGLVGAILN